MQIRATATYTDIATTRQRGDVYECPAEEAHRLITDGLAEAVVAAAPREVMTVTAPETGMRQRAKPRVAPKQKE